jgi:hypothetical protein
MAMVIGNVQTIKLYINCELLGLVTNTASITRTLPITIGNSGYGSNFKIDLMLGLMIIVCIIKN